MQDGVACGGIAAAAVEQDWPANLRRRDIQVLGGVQQEGADHDGGKASCFGQDLYSTLLLLQIAGTCKSCTRMPGSSDPLQVTSR